MKGGKVAERSVEESRSRREKGHRYRLDSSLGSGHWGGGSKEQASSLSPFSESTQLAEVNESGRFVIGARPGCAKYKIGCILTSSDEPKT